MRRWWRCRRQVKNMERQGRRRGRGRDRDKRERDAEREWVKEL
jgi:hypothetical protein